MFQNMEEKILNGLSAIGYNGSLLEKSAFNKVIDEGVKNIEYSAIVNYLANELRVSRNLDEQVNAITNPDDSNSFLMELSSFLKELGCPYNSLVQGHISDRLNNRVDRLILLDFLLTELMASRIIQVKKPSTKLELKLMETTEAADMRKILMTLRFPKPPSNITVQQLFQKLIPTVQNVVQRAGPELVGNPMFTGFLSDKQWDTLNTVQKDLHAEYNIRREMLLKRLDCTIQSFQWSDKTKGKEELIKKTYTEKRDNLKVTPNVSIANLLSARDDLAIIEKTSNSSVRKNTQSSVNKVIIGQVPDRGGRTSEQAPPPPEMPSWQQRNAGPSGGRGGGRGDFNNSYGGGRGRPQSSNYSNTGGSYDNNYGGNNYSRVGNDSNRGYSSNNYSGRDYNNKNDRSNYSRGGHNRSFDSAGSYDVDSGRGNEGGYGGYTNEPKRFKTYDSFQANKTSYAEQYVQDSQSNQQYNRQDNRQRGGGRGRSNYRRGGGGGGGYNTYR